MSWIDRIGEAAQVTESGNPSRLETVAVWTGAVLLLMILVLNTALD